MFFATRAALNLNDWEFKLLLTTPKSALSGGGLSLLNYHKLLDISKYSSLDSIKLSISITM